jgi:hypothetical protein
LTSDVRTLRQSQLDDRNCTIVAIQVHFHWNHYWREQEPCLTNCRIKTLEFACCNQRFCDVTTHYWPPLWRQSKWIPLKLRLVGEPHAGVTRHVRTWEFAHPNGRHGDRHAFALSSDSSTTRSSQVELVP